MVFGFSLLQNDRKVIDIKRLGHFRVNISQQKVRVDHAWKKVPIEPKGNGNTVILGSN